MKYIYLTILLLVSLFLAAFIQQNGEAIQLKYFYWSTPYLPVSIYMIACFVVGWIVALLASFATGMRFRFRASGAERELRQLRKELEELKTAELSVVNAEFEKDTKDPFPPEEESVVLGKDEEEKVSWHDHDPEAETVFTDSGGEEEK